MPTEFKLDILFLAIGISNLIMRSNRNWIFGYRSTRALQSHRAFAYANTIYSIGMLSMASAYFIWLYPNIGTKDFEPFWKQLICIGCFFVLKIVAIEYLLIRKFPNQGPLNK